MHMKYKNSVLTLTTISIVLQSFLIHSMLGTYPDISVFTVTTMIEVTKLVISSLILIFKYEYWSLRFDHNMLIISILYIVVNTITFVLLGKLPPGTFMMLTTHKMVFIFILSKFFLNKHLGLNKLVACLVNILGMFVLKGKEFGGFRVEDFNILVLTQGFCSSLASILTEKFMNKSDEHSDDNSSIKNYLIDSRMIYLYGCPFYALQAILFNGYVYDKPVDLNPAVVSLVAIVVLHGALSGLIIGAVLKFYGAINRVLIQSVGIVISIALGSLLDFNDNMNINLLDITGCTLVIISIFLYNVR